MPSVSVCRTKVHYDTEFEATRAAAIAESAYGQELIAYKCEPHWHITHKDPDLRRGFGKYWMKCRDCDELVKRSKLNRHRCIKEDDE